MKQKLPFFFLLATGAFIVILVVFYLNLDQQDNVSESATIEITSSFATRTPQSGTNVTLQPEVGVSATLELDFSANHIAELTLDEKVGQLFMVHFDGHTLNPSLRALIAECQVGGIILFTPNLRDAEQVKTLISEAQQLASETRPEVPLFVAIDQEGWPIARLHGIATTFPSNMAIAATGNPDNAFVVGQAMGRELRALGINMNLAPVLDVNANPRNPIIGLRSFGSDPESVANFGTAQIEGLQKNQIIAVAKHFPGHGDTSEDSHLTLPVIEKSFQAFKDVDLVPFQAAIEGDVDAIMTAHIVVREISGDTPATLSYEALTSLLREELGFDGLIATDSMGMNAITSSYGSGEAAVRAVKAGVDLLMYGNDPGQSAELQIEICRHMKQEVKNGGELAVRVEESAERIMNVKQEMGLLDAVPVTGNISGQLADNEALALQVARKSITEINANGSVLPLSPQDTVLVIYPDFIHGLDFVANTIDVNVRMLALGIDPTADQIALATERAVQADEIVLVTVDAFSHPQQVALYEALNQYDPVIVAMGLPYDISVLPDVGTYLASYGYSAPSQQAVMETLFGKNEATGVLPVKIE